MKLNEMLEVHEMLKRELEGKGYSGIVEYEKTPLRSRIACRLFQLALAAFFISLIFTAEVPRNVFASEASSSEKLITVLLPVIWVIIHYTMGWFFREAIGPVPPTKTKYLPVSGYFAKREMRMAIERLRTETMRFGKKERELEPILEKIAEMAVAIEEQLDGETELVREVGKNPCFKAIIERDAVLARIILPWECGPNAEFGERFIRLEYDVTRGGVYTELQYNVAILLEWKKTKLREKEIAKRAIEATRKGE